jgi:hypothetical protein
MTNTDDIGNGSMKRWQALQRQECYYQTLIHRDDHTNLQVFITKYHSLKECPSSEQTLSPSDLQITNLIRIGPVKLMLIHFLTID